MVRITIILFFLTFVGGLLWCSSATDHEQDKVQNSKSSEPAISGNSGQPLQTWYWSCGCKSEYHPDEYVETFTSHGPGKEKGALHWQRNPACDADAHLLNEESEYAQFTNLQGSSQEFGGIDTQNLDPGFKLARKIKVLDGPMEPK